jgi:hypothetical protein
LKIELQELRGFNGIAFGPANIGLVGNYQGQRSPRRINVLAGAQA